MSRIYWDTMLFVYWLEDREPYSETIGALFQRMVARGDRLCTSAFTLGELLVAPLRAEDKNLEELILKYFSESDIEILPFDAKTAKKYAQIRSLQKVTPADAIHLACAATAGVDLFLTNDLAIRKLVVPGIKFIDGLETTALGPL